MARATARADDDEWVDLARELTVPAPKKAYKPGTLFKRPTYSFDNAADFQDLTPEQIVTTELYLINPKVDAGKTAVKTSLNEQQRKALLRLMAIKQVVDTIPQKNKEKVRLDLIRKYEISRGDGDGEVKRLLDEATDEVRAENFQRENEARFSKKKDEALARQVAKLKNSGGKRTRRRVSKTRARKSKTRKCKTRKSKTRKCKSKTHTRKSKRRAIKI